MRLVVAALLVAGSITAACAEPVATEGGLVAGIQEGTVRAFKGIPYAAPPVEDLRWKAPQPAPAWVGVMSADRYSPQCPQTGAYPPEAAPEPMGEDCLTLNVWTPA